MRKHPVTIYQYQGRCVTTAFGNLLKMLFICQFGQRTRSCMDYDLWQTRSYAIIVHNLVQADYISKQRSNVIRETLNTSTCTKGHAQEYLVPAAAAFAAAVASLCKWVHQHCKACRMRIGRTRAIQPRIQFSQGNQCETLLHLLKNSLRSKSIFE